MENILERAKGLFEYAQARRRDFHRHPELGFQEYRTAKIVAAELGALDLDQIQTGVGKTGVVALLKGASPGPVVLLRFDMDALPIQEETGAEYASQNPGVMHACGHDAHTAIGLTVAKILADQRENLAGSVKFVFQPAEEGQGGADSMVKEGVLENPRPDYVLAVHVWNDQPLGWFGITPGPTMAAADCFRVTISGKGGHGAVPHQAMDPVLAASQVVNALQSVVSRNIHPLESAVVTVSSIQGGTAFNVIPPKVELSGTIRTFKRGVRQTVLNRFKAVTEGVSQAFGCSAEIEVNSLTLAVSNHPELTGVVQSTATRLFPQATIANDFATMGSEDFSYMMQDVPGCFVFIGSSNAAKGLDAMHHHPRFDIDEAALVNGVALLARVTADLLS